MFRRSLGGMSVFAMLMTIPQVFTIWIGHQATGDPTAAAKAVEDTAAIAIVRQWKRVRGRLVIGLGVDTKLAARQRWGSGPSGPASDTSILL